MIGLVWTCLAFTDDFLWWWTIYNLRREAREAVARLEHILQHYYTSERTRGG